MKLPPFDLIVIGSGPAGQKAALQGAKAGKKVAIIEEYTAFGGGCVHFGTLPSKAFRESVYRYSLGSRGTLGQEVEHSVASRSKTQLPDMHRLLRRKDRVVSAEAQVVFDQFKRNGVEVFHGHARIQGPNTVDLVSKKGRQLLEAQFIFIATGSRPVAPNHLKVDEKLVFDSNSILRLESVPEALVVLGGGIIGCEYASIFSMAGTKVYLVDKRHEILASVDREIVDHLVERFEHQGMEVILDAECKKIEKVPGRTGKKDQACITLSTGKEIEANVVLVALGRYSNTDNLGLENVGIPRDERGLIQVDRHFRTVVSSIYAVGDVIGYPALASTSMEQGRIACCHAFGLPGVKVMPDLYPYGIYTIPEISMVGMGEEELKTRKIEYVVGRSPYREIARGQIVGDKWGLLKLLVDRKTLKILGVHIVGDNAADLVHPGQIVMSFGGDVTYFIQNVFNYPTYAQAYKAAAFNAINQIQGVYTMSLKMVNEG